MQRVIFSLILLVLTPLMPWWVMLVLLLAYIWRFSFAFEAVGIAACVDLLYAHPVFGSYHTPIATFLLLCIPLLEAAKGQLRFGYHEHI